MNRIDLWLKALKQAFARTGQIAPWPMPIGEVAPYFSNLEATDLYKKLKIIDRHKGKIKLSDLFISPGSTKSTLMDLIIGLKVAKPAINPDERVWFVEKIFDALKSVQSGDIFCLDGTNRIWTPEEAQQIYDQTPWTTVRSNKNLVQSFYKVSASIKVLIWSLYFYGWDDVGYQHHGPYDIVLTNGRKDQMVVSDFFDLRPTTLWPNISKFPYKSAQLLVLYRPKVKVTIDIFDHPSVEGCLSDMTLAVFLQVNGKVVRNVEVADRISQEILSQVSKQQHLIRNMTRQKIAWKFMQSRYYAFRKWRAAFGEDWRPPQEILQRIRTWPEIKIPDSNEPGWKELKHAFDPRTDYVPGQSL